jgi:hypothetical protein
MLASNPLRFAFAILLLLASTAQAQLFRTYLSGAGNDANPCTLPQPCRLLPAALNAVSSGGEVWMIDSANYNTSAVTIDKSVSILAVPGVIGSFVAQNGGPALQITANGLTVALRNMAIGRVATAAVGTHGVLMTGDSSLTIEDSVIDRLPQNGVRVQGTGSLHLLNTFVRLSGSYAVLVLDGAEATIVNANIVNNNGGIGVVSNQASRTSRASISDSFISGVDNAGIRSATTVANAGAEAFVTRSTIERSGNAGYGLRAESDGGGTASITISGSTVASHTNVWGISGAGSTIVSLGDNHIRDYTTAFGTLTNVPLQ